MIPAYLKRQKRRERAQAFHRFGLYDRSDTLHTAILIAAIFATALIVLAAVDRFL